MSAIVLPKRFYTQPQSAVQIDWNNPITLGLVGGIDGPTGKYIAGLTGFVPYTEGLGSPTATTTNMGAAVFRYGVNNLLKVPKFTSTASMTMLHIATVGSGTLVSRASAGCSHIGNSYTFQISNSNGTTAGAICGQIYLGGYRTVGGSVTLPAGSTYIAAFVHKHGVGQEFWLNGIKDSATTAYTGSSLGNTYYGINNSKDSLSTVGALLLNLIWNRALSDSEVKSLSANPWQIFKVSE